MDSFLSGFSHNYAAGNQQVGQSHVGNTSGAGTAGASQTSSGVDVSQLQPGDTFQGEIASINGEDVQIQLANGQYMAAKLERDVQVALGQFLNLQVQSNKDNRIVLKPVYDSNMQMLRVGESALRAANLAINDKNLQLVSTLIENGMSINKSTLMMFNRLALQHPQVDLSVLINLTRLKLPVTDINLAQYQNYQNLEHRLLDSVNSASEEVLTLYDMLAAGSDAALRGTEAALGQAENYMEQILNFLSGEEVSQESVLRDGVMQNGEAEAAGQMASQHETVYDGISVPESLQGGTDAPNSAAAENIAGQETVQKEIEGKEETVLKEIENQLKGTSQQNLPDKIISLIRDGNLDIKGMKWLLSNQALMKSLTPEIKDKVFHSEAFKSLVRKGLQRQWTLEPQELTQEGKLQEFYQKLARQSGKLSQLMNDAMNAAQQGTPETSTRALTNIRENVEFMNQMNQMFNYVQLPLKLSNSQAHGDLYVYTNKKNLARKDGMLTAFLHLDMENLGGMDISITLQTERNQVTTKFYLEEHAFSIIEEHIEELTQRLEERGYQCKNSLQIREEEKTILQRMEEQVSGGNVTLSYQTFDTRA